MTKTLPSNIFWGKKSGIVYKDGTLAFRAKKYSNGKESRGSQKSCTLKNVNHKWFS